MLGCLVGWSLIVSLYVCDLAGQVHILNVMLTCSVFSFSKNLFFDMPGVVYLKESFFALENFFCFQKYLIVLKTMSLRSQNHVAAPPQHNCKPDVGPKGGLCGSTLPRWTA